MKFLKGSSLGRGMLAFWPDSAAHVTPEPDRASLPEFALPIHLRARDGMALVDVTELVALANWSEPVQNRAEWFAAVNACRGRGLCVPALPETLYVRPDGALCLIALPYDEPSPGSLDALANLFPEEGSEPDEFDCFTPDAEPDEFDCFTPDADAPETATLSGLVEAAPDAPGEPAEAEPDAPGEQTEVAHNAPGEQTGVAPDAPAPSAPSFTPPNPAFAPDVSEPEPEQPSESDIWGDAPLDLDFSHPVLELAGSEPESEAEPPRVNPAPAVEPFSNLNVDAPFSFDAGGAAPSAEGKDAGTPTAQDDDTRSEPVNIVPPPFFPDDDRDPPRKSDAPKGGGKGGAKREPEQRLRRRFLGLGGGKSKRKPPADDPLDDLFFDVPAASKLASGKLYLSKKRGMTRGAILIPKDERVTIGRTAAKSQIVLAHRDVSEQHASISFQHGAYFLTDDDSSYGTWLNGVQLVKGEPQRIDPMAEILFASNRYYAVFEED